MLKYFAPRADLRDFISVYYLYEPTAVAAEPMAAELANIRFVLEGGGDIEWADGRRGPFSAASLLGPSLMPYRTCNHGPTRVLGAGVKPAAFPALVRAEAQSLADRLEDFRAGAGPEVDRAVERMRNAATDAALIGAADDLFAWLLRRADRRAGSAGLIERWLDQDGGDIDGLAEALDLSHRQVDRLCKRFFGASPKVLQRRQRVTRAAMAIALDPATRLSSLAADEFYDQPHFIKEFRAFVGLTPKRFAAGAAPLLMTSLKMRALAAR